MLRFTITMHRILVKIKDGALTLRTEQSRLGAEKEKIYNMSRMRSSSKDQSYCIGRPSGKTRAQQDKCNREDGGGVGNRQTSISEVILCAGRATKTWS